MTDHELRDLLVAHTTRDEPPFLLDPALAMAAGRRRRRTRTVLAAGGAALAVAASAAVVVGVVQGRDGGADDSARLDPATADALDGYDASAMPGLLDDRAGGVLRRSVDDLGDGRFRASDSQGQRIPEKWWGKASGMSTTWGSPDHDWSVTLMHARSEAEGDKQRICDDGLSSGYAFRCSVTTTAAGDVAVMEVTAARPLDEELAGGRGMLGALTRGEIETGELLPGNPSDRPLDPSETVFTRSVEVVHSETFLTRADETVRAPTLAAAERLFEVPVADLTDIATDPRLVIPEPPIGEGNCPWTLPGTGVECSVAEPDEG